MRLRLHEIEEKKGFFWEDPEALETLKRVEERRMEILKRRKQSANDKAAGRTGKFQLKKVNQVH